MDNHISAMGIINTLQTNGAYNCHKYVSAGLPWGGEIVIAKNDIHVGTETPQEVLPPIPVGACIAITKHGSQAEQRQIVFIGKPTGTVAVPVRETIVASTKYKILINHQSETQNTSDKPVGIYATPAPAVLSGTAATDRLNIFTILASKINAHVNNHVEAFLVYSVAFTGGVTALPVVGETVTQLTSNVTAKVAAVWVGSGTITGTDAAGIIFLYDFSAIASWSSASKTLTGGTSGFVCTTAAVLTTGEGLVIVDDAGYFPAGEAAVREGACEVFLAEGFQVYSPQNGQDNTLTVGVIGFVSGLPALYSRGIGSDILARMPVYDITGNLVRGDANLSKLNEDPDTTKTYTTFYLTIRRNTDIAQLGHPGGSPADMIYALLVSEGDPTDLGQFEVQMESDFALTIN